MLQQKLVETKKKEEILRVKFEETRAEAVKSQRPIGASRIAGTRHQAAWRHERRAAEPDRIARSETKWTGSPRGGDRGTQSCDRSVSPKLTYVIIIDTSSAVSAQSLGLVTIFDALDDRFRSMEELQSRLGIAVLTVIQRLKDAGDHGIAGTWPCIRLLPHLNAKDSALCARH